MIICPNCKQEIDDDSHYCDQCGEQLLFCERCGHVGQGQRCTQCGAAMITAEEREERASRGNFMTNVAMTTRGNGYTTTQPTMPGATMPQQAPQMVGPQQLVLYHAASNTRLVAQNGAIIGRRQGQYKDFFAQDGYVSGIHAQLLYNVNTGWSVIDKHSSNGTRVNRERLSPDVPMQLHNGDILSIANIDLQVSIR